MTDKADHMYCKQEQSRLLRQQQFVNKSNQVHNHKYGYDLVFYINNTTKVTILCPVHGTFEQTPAAHANAKQGCKKCANEYAKLSLADFKHQAANIHSHKYNYALVTHDNFGKRHHTIPIICDIHGIFEQRWGDHLNGRGCKKCSRSSASNKALTWLDYVSTTEGVEIQHAGNGVEYTIPGTRYRADGYCAQTHTIYEFDGDAYHGNPSRYAPDERCHPFDKTKTAEELYCQTSLKHQEIRDRGFNLVTIWESDYDQLNIETRRYQAADNRQDSSYPDRLLVQGLEIVGEYLGSKLRHDLRCLVCGNVHNATPVSKIWIINRYPNTYGCPECNHRRTSDVKRKNSDYPSRLLALGYKSEDYTNATTKCHIVCVVCNRVKFVKPSSIISWNKPCSHVGTPHAS